MSKRVLVQFDHIGSHFRVREHHGHPWRYLAVTRCLAWLPLGVVPLYLAKGTSSSLHVFSRVLLPADPAAMHDLLLKTHRVVDKLVWLVRCPVLEPAVSPLLQQGDQRLSR